MRKYSTWLLYNKEKGIGIPVPYLSFLLTAMVYTYPPLKLVRLLRVCETPQDKNAYQLDLLPLNETERVRLRELEAIVAQGLQTFYEVGQALIEIRDRKFYRESHKTFEAYCKETWNLTRPSAYRLLKAAEVMKNLSPIGDKIPTKESQVRPLTKLPPAQQLEIWQKAVEESPNGIPTAKIVERLGEEQGYSEQKKKPLSEMEQLRQENQQLKETIKQRDLEREQRANLVAAELERLREENRQLKAELRQRDKDWEIRLAMEKEKIRAAIEQEK